MSTRAGALEVLFLCLMMVETVGKVISVIPVIPVVTSFAFKDCFGGSTTNLLEERLCKICYDSRNKFTFGKYCPNEMFNAMW
jgi:hypothetical protein